MSFLGAVAVGMALVGWAPSAQAARNKDHLDSPTALTGQDIPYETIAGRAWGELDAERSEKTPSLPHRLAAEEGERNVEYIASFFIVKPSTCHRPAE